MAVYSGIGFLLGGSIESKPILHHTHIHTTSDTVNHYLWSHRMLNRSNGLDRKRSGADMTGDRPRI